MTDDLFYFVDARASQIERDASSIGSSIEVLGSLQSFKTRPEASVRRAAERLREAAACLDELADKAPKPVVEAA